MKNTNTIGPMSAGASVPSVKKFGGDPAESPHGVAMHPGFDHTSHPFTSRTPAKHKTGWREPIPKTPRG